MQGQASNFKDTRASSVMPWSPAHVGFLLKGSPMLFSSGRVIVSFCLAVCRSALLRISPLHAYHSLRNLRRESRATHSSMALPRGGSFILGGHFLLTGSHSEVLLHSLPPIVHIRREASRKVMRWSLECLKEELYDPQPGGSLIAQQLAYIMLVQALRLHLEDQAGSGVGWLFALSDPQMRTAITCMHDDPSHAWTLQKLANRVGMSRTVFAQTFKSRVGMTSMEYLTRWRMLLAGDRLRSSDDPISQLSSSVGYETDSAFGRAFKKVWGCSPREHRRRVAPPAADEVTARREAQAY